MTVIDNVIVGALIRTTVMREARRKAYEVLEFAGLAARADVLGQRSDPVGKAPARSRARARDRTETAAAR